MKVATLVAAALCAVIPASSHSQTADVQGATAMTPVTVEYYYRLRWGSAGEFKELYKKNHAPLLQEMQRQGRILRIETEEPFTHLSGGVRWDLRVTITYRDADAALSGPALMNAWEKAWERLYAPRDPEGAKFMAEESRRFSIVEDHWDVVVKPSN